jgi:hypothetical protein
LDLKLELHKGCLIAVVGNVGKGYMKRLIRKKRESTTLVVGQQPETVLELRDRTVFRLDKIETTKNMVSVICVRS